MIKGIVLQEWAQHDPQHWTAAISHWTNTRLRLSKTVPRPPEYYQVVLNAASCLLEQSKANGDAALANQAIQLLKTTLALASDLKGTDVGDQLRATLTKAQSMTDKVKKNGVK